MAMMLSKTYAAFIKAGVDDPAAREAAEELASYESKIGDIRSDLNLLKWMVGLNLTATFGVIAKLLHG